MKFTDIFIKRPVLALVVSLLILLIGLKCLLGLQIRQYPRLYNTTITVTTVYPGASPDLIQGFITTPIEQAVATAEGIDYLTSNSVQGNSTVTAYIRLNYDPSQALTDVMAKVQQVKYLMPGQAKGFFTVTNIAAGTGLADVDQFKRMVVKSAGGALVRMEDIARVDLGAQSWTSSVMMNGQHAVFIGVQATPTGNPLSLVAG